MVFTSVGKNEGNFNRVRSYNTDSFCSRQIVVKQSFLHIKYIRDLLQVLIRIRYYNDCITLGEQGELRLPVGRLPKISRLKKKNLVHRKCRSLKLA